MDGDEFASVDDLLLRPEREIAAIKKDLGLKVLTDHLLISKTPANSLNQAKLIKTENHIQLTLGHFSTKDKRGESVFACQIYDKVSVTYESNAIIDNNSATPSTQTMVFELPCTVAENDIKHLTPVSFAPAKILKETPGDGTFPFGENNEFSVSFQNVEDQWPRQWSLKSVQFRDSQSINPPKEISTSELTIERRQSLNMDWTRYN